MSTSLSARVVLSGTILLMANIAIGDIVVFDSDFNGSLPAEISGAGSLVGVQSYVGLGPAGNQFSGNFLQNSVVTPTATSLVLTGLPAHTSLDINFLLAIIDSWDGDTLSVLVDGTTIFSENFENSGVGTQTYVPPAGGELARKVDLGFTVGGFWFDSAYDMGVDPIFDDIPHSSSSLTIEWIPGQGWQGGTDESFAIDNLTVTINGTVPEPSHLLMLGLFAIGVQRRRRTVMA